MQRAIVSLAYLLEPVMHDPTEPAPHPNLDASTAQTPELLEPAPEPPVEQATVEPVPDVTSPDPLAVLTPSYPVLNATAPTTAPRRQGLPGTLWLMAVLIPYAIVTTIGVIYLLQRQQLTAPGVHILESIPDQGLYEDFLDGRRREAAVPLNNAADRPPPLKVIPTNEPLPPEAPPLRLGQTRRIGDLAVTPLDVTRQTLQYDWKDGQRQVPGDEALVLKLQVKNEGKLIFRPDDETFNRAYLDDNRTPVYTYLQAGTQRFYGAVADPSRERLSLPVCGPLLPGETGTMYVTAARGLDGKVTLPATLVDPLVWRVQLRRGKEEVTMTTGRKRSVWVTAVIGISLTAADIRRAS